MHVPDSIVLGMIGAFGVGKTTLCQTIKDPRYNNRLLETILEGNYWVPPQVAVFNEGQARELFDRYSADPKRYASEYQVFQVVDRYRRQRTATNTPGISIIDMPLCADRHGYAEANRENMGDSFSTYLGLYSALESSVRHPDAYIYLRVREDQVEVILDRIKKRGRPNEQKFLEDPAYIINLIRLWEDFHTKVKEPVITIDASKISLDGEIDETYVNSALQHIGNEIHQIRAPLRLSLDAWCNIDLDQAGEAANQAKSQLSAYVHQHQVIFSLLGLVAVGKTTFAKKLARELGVDLVRELQGLNNSQLGEKDRFLGLFLGDKLRYCNDFQDYMADKRYVGRVEAYSKGRSIVEDRSPEEDPEIFHRRFEAQGLLSPEQRQNLLDRFQRESKKAPPASLWIILNDTPQNCLQRMIRRGRVEELAAWPKEELIEFEVLYKNIRKHAKEDGLYGGHAIEFNMGEVNLDSEVHCGFVYQEMHHTLMQNR